MLFFPSVCFSYSRPSYPSLWTMVAYILFAPMPFGKTMNISAISLKAMVAQSAGAVDYTDAPLQRSKNPTTQTSVLDMILNNLMVRFQ